MAVSARLFLVALACLGSASGGYQSRLMIDPQSPVLEIGTNFTARCTIINTTEITADDIYWILSDTTVPDEQYTKINKSALNVTLLVTGENHEWLYCGCKKKSNFVYRHSGTLVHGIFLKKGYRPTKPEDLSCMAFWKESDKSPTIRCEWKPVERQTPDVPTTYTVFVKFLLSTEVFNVSTQQNYTEVVLNIYPFHMIMDIWVEAKNTLGRVESEHLIKDADWFVKTNPPSDVKAMVENSFPTSLLMSWTPAIDNVYMGLRYQIRFCPTGSDSWISVPAEDVANDIESFRLQNLHPDTVYDIQVRCRNDRKDRGYWSEWSTNTTERTPANKPTSKPDLWLIFAQDDGNERRVQFICKDPKHANGRITRFNVKIEDSKNKVNNESWESISVNRSDSSSTQTKVTELKEIRLADDKSVKVSVTASNSLGESPRASLVIPEKTHVHAPVEELKVLPHGEKLWLGWKPPKGTAVSEYVVEWATGAQMDWQRESRSTTQTTVNGKLEKFVLYSVSVYPIFSGSLGKPARLETYLEQGAPLEGPFVRVNGKPGCDEANLVWNEIPQHRRQGFITNYTIIYANGTERHAVVVPGNVTSYTLKSLSRDTKYDIQIKASTIAGSFEGSNHSFTTLKYAPGEMELIVVGGSLGFLFVAVMTMVLCLYKKDVIKKNFWPQIPDPGESTIGNWSPDYSLKEETPKENCLSGISVLDVDVCDGKCVFEEDKASHPLKKDKYLSEEHSSGIGGSSCMSSPRQSVSDSDEGGDMADTTASTVQYSSVVASSGYKGQTPSSQPQQAIFSRSESTQPLLDSEENPDMLVQEGSRQSQRFSRQPCFKNGAGNKDSTSPADFKELEMEQQELLESLDFCPLEEDSEHTTPADDHSADWLLEARVSSYMPQLGGYRPQ